MSTSKVSRRAFIKSGVFAASALSLAGCGIGSRRLAGKVGTPRKIGPDGTLNVAAVGCGGKGRSDILEVAKGNNVKIVALCDVDDKRASKIYKMYPDVPKYKDYRIMLDEMGEQIDAVTVTTPDHMHFPVAKKAIEMGKHVYVQKPLTHTIEEAQELLELARKHKVATQMGNQGHTFEGTRLMKEWVDAGALGDVREVHLWTNRPIWPQGIGRPAEVLPVPDTLDWNLWLGVAPKRPYNPGYAPFNWRGWWDFGTGALGDMGCHIMDASFYALDLGDPISVEAESGPVNDETAPKWSIVAFQFPARGKKPPVKVTWYDGGKMPPRPADLPAGQELRDNGQLLIGDKGTILAGTYAKSARIYPEKRMKEVMQQKIPKTIRRVPEGSHVEWVNSCKGGPVACSNFEYSVPLTKMVLIGNLAIRSGKKVEWNGSRMCVTNVPSANAFVTKEYRCF